MPLRLLKLSPLVIILLLTNLALVTSATSTTSHSIDPIFIRTGWRKIINPYSGPGAVWCPNITSLSTSASASASATASLFHEVDRIESSIPQPTMWSSTDSSWWTVSVAVAEITNVLRKGGSTTGSPSTSKNGTVRNCTHAAGPARFNSTLNSTMNELWTSILTVTVTITEFSDVEVTSAMSMPNATRIEHSTDSLSITADRNSTITLTAKATVTSTSTIASDIVSLSTSTSSSKVSTSTKSSSTSQASAVPLATSSTIYRGFNIINQSPANPSTFKSLADWTHAFHNIRSLPGAYNAVRLYSTTDGPNVKHLLNAIPAARSQNLSMHIGVWSGGDAHKERFATEKAALDEALTQLRCDGIIAVSVGNEDMYNHHLADAGRTPLSDITLLVNQTREIKAILTTHGCSTVKLTHTDTYGDWLQTNISAPLIHAVDVLTVNIFPYWSGEHIDTASAAFFAQLHQTQEMAATYGKDIWVGETGWPVTGDRVRDAVPGVENARKYWDQVGCRLMRSNISAFWYVEYDAGMAPPSFGAVDAQGGVIVGDMRCV